MRCLCRYHFSNQLILHCHNLTFKKMKVKTLFVEHVMMLINNCKASCLIQMMWKCQLVVLSLGKRAVEVTLKIRYLSFSSDG